jgi:hypothetical protein
MHQPMVLQNGDITQAEVISNLKQMFDHMEEGDNHNAPVFAWCYSRIADFVRELVDHGKNPRVMLDYSGNLLWGLVKMGRGDILENLWSVTCDAKYQPYVEWLGSMWSHAVVPSTPVPDIAGREGEVFEATHRKGPIFLNCTNISIGALKSAFGIALHMHQPMVLQNGDITQAEVISNLKQMFDHVEEGDNHNAPVFAWCYSRTADFVRELVDHGKNPRVMLDYSGNLLWGLVKMGRGDILENLWSVTCDA